MENEFHDFLSREEIIQRIKELSLTFYMLDDTEITTIIKNSQDTTNITDYEISQIIKNIKTSIDSLSQPSLDIMSSVSKVIENYDYKNWKTDKILGRGVYGVVTKQTFDDKKLAFKTFDMEMYDIPGDFICEVGTYAILTAIESENTPKLIGFNFKKLGIATELFTINLSRFTPMPEYETETTAKRKQLLPEIIDMLLESLADIQSVGIIHNDIKPDNMLITLNPDGSVVKACLTDFGLSSSVPQIGWLCYANAFRAPELWADGLKKDSYSSFATDCWAFGTSIIFLCTGEIYYENDVSFMTKPILPTDDMTSKLSKYLRPDQVDTINRMISWNPKDRCITRNIVKIPDRLWNVEITDIETGFSELYKKFHVKPFTMAMTIDIFYRYCNYEIETDLRLSAICALYIASLWAGIKLIDGNCAKQKCAKDFANKTIYKHREITKHTLHMLNKLNGLIWLPGLDKVVENLSGPSKDIEKKLKTIDLTSLLE
jgi:hypothetical protein